ncbi:methyl-accepting chemotaxis protein [Uliginosibacterium paludis]|uniref:Methyl-accepting chemotaxis protein n=1 Tax=Uliginosibacterium paludis TaxID=1615952 RepID=A0ABV2CV48_9RHOO
MNLSITQRLLLLSGASILALLLVLGSGYFAARAPQQGMAVLEGNTLPSVHLLSDIERDVLNVRRLIIVHALELYDTKKREHEGSMKEARKRIDENLDRYEKEMVRDDHERELAGKVREQIKAYDRFLAEVASKSNDFDVDGARELITTTGVPLGNAMSVALDELRKYNDEEADQLHAETETAVKRYERLAFVVGVIAVVLVSVLGFLLVRSIRESLHAVQDAVEHIERERDFTRRVKVLQQDELGAIGNAFNRLVARMHDSLVSISSGAQALAASAGQMAGSSEQVARSAAGQSEAASSMAATVEEMTVSINHVADRAQDANAMTSSSSHLAANGELVISQTVRDINDIAESVNLASGRINEFGQHGERISSVVAVIKDVADQTNLLALNAAIEAARAGEQGRGFAVVADEVRKLAERTANSTAEISQSIEAMRGCAEAAVECMEEAVRRVAVGVSGAEETNVAIQQIRAGSEQAVQRVEDIALSIREQGSATNSIAGQVERIARISEENSAVASQSAEAAVALDRLARQMHDTVAVYRL